MQTLVDTSVWVDHFRGEKRANGLADLLDEQDLAVHPAIVGELALGYLGRRRREVLESLAELPVSVVAENGEVLEMVETHGLHGLGIGWVDAHLLASALLSGVRLWTFDRRLQAAAGRAGVQAV